jgi:hypothetical protein
MANLSVPHPLDPDWKWKEFARQERRARAGSRRRWLLDRIAQINRLLVLVGCEIRHAGNEELHIKLGAMRVRVQRFR